MRSDLVYIDVCSDLVDGVVCRIWLLTMRSEIFCSLLLLDVMNDSTKEAATIVEQAKIKIQTTLTAVGK